MSKLSKKQFEKEVEKLLKGSLTQIFTMSICIGKNGVCEMGTGNQKINDLFLDNLGEEYNEIYEEFVTKADKLTKNTGKKLADLLVKKALPKSTYLVSEEEGEKLKEILNKVMETIKETMLEQCEEDEEECDCCECEDDED